MFYVQGLYKLNVTTEVQSCVKFIKFHQHKNTHNILTIMHTKSGSQIKKLQNINNEVHFVGKPMKPIIIEKDSPNFRVFPVFPVSKLV